MWYVDELEATEGCLSCVLCSLHQHCTPSRAPVHQYCTAAKLSSLSVETGAAATAILTANRINRHDVAQGCQLSG
jgi:hypothetical protein